MVILLLVMGELGLILAGNAVTRFMYTGKAAWLFVGMGEVVIGTLFILAAIGKTIE